MLIHFFRYRPTKKKGPDCINCNDIFTKKGVPKVLYLVSQEMLQVLFFKYEVNMMLLNVICRHEVINFCSDDFESCKFTSHLLTIKK